MLFRKVFQFFTIITVVSLTSFGVASDSEQALSAPEEGGTETPIQREFYYDQPVNMTDEVCENMKNLELTEFITSLFIGESQKDCGKNKRPLLNEPDQKKLAKLLQDSAVKQLIFKNCSRFELGETLEEALKAKHINLSWK